MSARVKIADKGAEKFVARMRALVGKHTVRVGVMGPKAAAKHKGSDLTNVDLAIIHEHGARIKHPGGTRFVVTPRGAFFLRADSPVKETGVTRPHDITIPARPFLRPELDEHVDHWRKRLATELQKAVKARKDPLRALHVVGEEYRTAVIRRVKEHVSPPLAASTVARKKGEAIPLIDTGAMIGAISVVVT